MTFHDEFYSWLGHYCYECGGCDLSSGGEYSPDRGWMPYPLTWADYLAAAIELVPALVRPYCKNGCRFPQAMYGLCFGCVRNLW